MLMILAVFSIYFGFITKDMFIGLGSGFFSDNALFIHPSNEIMLDTEFGVPTLFKLLPLILTISLIVIVIVLSEYLSTILIYFKLSRVGYNIFSFFNQRFLIELFYNEYITGNILKLGGQTTKEMDKGSVEFVGPYGAMKLLYYVSTILSKLNKGIITTYALYILLGVILYLSIPYIELHYSIAGLLVLSRLFITEGYKFFESEYVIIESSFNPGSNNNNNPGSNNNNNTTNNNDSDVEMEDSSGNSDNEPDRPATPEEVSDRNERDMEIVETLQEENRDLRDLFGTAEKLRDRQPVSDEDYDKYMDANLPSLNEIERDIRRNEDRIEELEESMVNRRRADYELSENSESESSESNNNGPAHTHASNNNGPAHTHASNNNGQLSYDPDNYSGSVSPDSSDSSDSSDYNGPRSPNDSNNNGSSFSDTRSLRDFDNSCKTDTESPIRLDYDIGFKFYFNHDNTTTRDIDSLYDNTDPLNIDFFSDSSERVDKTTFIESLCSALSIGESLFTQLPLISMLGLIYRFYKLGFFNDLTALYKLSFFHALMCSRTYIFWWFIFLFLLMIIFIFIIL